MTAVQSSPVDLREFQLTLRIPPGQTAKQFLSGFVGYMNANPPRIGVVHEEIPIAEQGGWRLTTTIYLPEQQTLAVPILFFHGGAWCFGSPLTHDRLSRELASRGMAIFSVDYRRAPKHPFPGAVEDGLTAVDWLKLNAGRFGCRDDVLFVAGDSAGANIAAGVSVSVSKGDLAGAVLIGGIFDYERSLAVLGDLLAGEGDVPLHYVRPDDLEWARRDQRLNPSLMPGSFPPTLIISGNQDPLHDESLHLATSLINQGIDVDTYWVEGEGHGFIQDPASSGYDRAFDRIESFINKFSTNETEVKQ